MFLAPARSFISCIALVTIGSLSLLTASSAFGQAELPALADSVAEPRPSGFALIELFTSQGCSSCPPADRLLTELISDTAQPPVYALSFHVDYWNRLGWKDPFSEPAFSQRQERYAAAVGSGRMYTPQMVVNGRQAFVGSHRRRATEAIDAALAGAGRVHIAATGRPVMPSSVRIDYRVSGRLSGEAVLNIAVLDSWAETQVSRGENGGRKLSHSHVVRKFVTFPLAPSSLAGTTEIQLPAPFDRRRQLIYLYVQDAGSMAVLGATAVSFAEAPAAGG